MIKKYPWHFIFLIFVIFSLTNIFQKLQWKSITDNIEWAETSVGLVCEKAPVDSHIKPGDLLITINKYEIKDRIDLQQAISQRKTCIYKIERDELLKREDVDISYEYTSTSYYILVFSGVILLLITLMLLNINLKKHESFIPPVKFYLLSLSFSGFMIFSPTGTYNFTDFVFLFLDRFAFVFFPALLLHFAIYFPLRSSIFKKIRPKVLISLIYIPPFSILILYLYFLLSNIINPSTIVVIAIINYFRDLMLLYFSVYLLASLIFFIISSLKMIKEKNQKRFIMPLAGVSISIPFIILFNIVFPPAGSPLLLNLSLFFIVLLPLSITYFLSHKKFRDIEIIIKRTLSISTILLFIFGIFFFLGFNIEKNKLVGIFWSILTIITAGLLFKPIEGAIQEYFEKFFLKGTFNFRKKLRELIQSLRTERDLSALAVNLLNTINNGFQLKNSSLIIHLKKNIFLAYPRKGKILLSKSFLYELSKKENLVFSSESEFEKRYSKDYRIMKEKKFFQFLPLITQGRLIGLVAFGLKKDNTYLSVEDWELLYSITSSLTLSVENASLYSELENQFNEINLLKEFHENVIENINMGLVVLTKLNIIKTWNNFMELKFKLPAKRTINKKALKIFDNKLWKEIYLKKNNATTLSNISVEIKNDQFIFNIHVSPLKDSIGKIMGTILVFEDVTDNIHMQNQLITSEKMASIGLLSAGIAHEVNTPLTGISSYCQIILDDPDNEDNTKLVSKMQDQVERANKIIRTLLDFSRQQGEKPVNLDLNKVLNESISLVEHTIKKKNINLKKNYNFSKNFCGFPTRLQQLFINLLINASDAINENNGEIKVEGHEGHSGFNVKISDNGTGIEGKNLKKLFDPFFTTKEKGEGTGLGLSIIYNIVEEHYGKISVDSNINKGTVFTIMFPYESPLRSIKI
ncbi:MAG: ATP-binding protein [Acidobacteriota bacterium]